VRVRTFKTRTGHHLQFTEEDKGGSKKGVQIKSVSGHQVYLNDSDRTIEIKTSGGHVVKLDDAGQSISLKSTGSVSIKATTTLDLQAGGIITVQGAFIKLN
jgi:FlaG/FlaF family flagellin (archaellin)